MQLLSKDEEKERWITYAWRLLVFTVVYNIVEGVVSVYWGFDDQSVSLFGFGLDSMIEVFSSAIVLWHMYHEMGLDLKQTSSSKIQNDVSAVDEQRSSMFSLNAERKATFTIGVLLLLLSISAMAGGTIRLISKSGPKSTVIGILISSLSLSFMFFLWYYKTKAAVILNSSTLTSDANCSLGCIKLSCILLIGSLVYFITNTLWWADASTAILIGILVAYEGYSTIKESMSQSFSGGCGCCSGSDTWLAKKLRSELEQSIKSQISINRKENMIAVNDESSDNSGCKDGCCAGSNNDRFVGVESIMKKNKKSVVGCVEEEDCFGDCCSQQPMKKEDVSPCKQRDCDDCCGGSESKSSENEACTKDEDGSCYGDCCAGDIDSASMSISIDGDVKQKASEIISELTDMICKCCANKTLSEQLISKDTKCCVKNGCRRQSGSLLEIVKCACCI